MIATIFKHPCGKYRVKFDEGRFFLPVIMTDLPQECRDCDRHKPLEEGRSFCCIADGVGETHLTIKDIRAFAIQKWQREQETAELAANARLEKETP